MFADKLRKDSDEQAIEQEDDETLVAVLVAERIEDLLDGGLRVRTKAELWKFGVVAYCVDEFFPEGGYLFGSWDWWRRTGVAVWEEGVFQGTGCREEE